MIFGLRALNSYRNLKSPLSLLFAITGLSIGLSWAFWAFPFLFLDANLAENKLPLIVFISIGDSLLFLALALQIRVYWYLTLQNVIKFVYVGLPVGLVALVGLFFSIKASVDNPHLPMVLDGRAILATNPISHVAQLMLIVIIIMTGIELLKAAAKQNNKRSKVGSVSIALLYLTAGIGGAMNILSDSTTTNASPLVVASYALGLVFFILVFLVFRVVDIHKSRAQDL